jgi:thioredoxin-dependent peroxiredoxin
MIGNVAPDFLLKDQNGRKFHLYEELNKIVVLVFYPKDDSPVCTMQLVDYQKNLESFSKAGINVVGINTESEDSHRRFRDKCSLGFPLLSDPEKKVSKDYDALNILGINKRKIVVIDTDKNIVFEKVNFPFNFISSVEILDQLGVE